MGWFELWRPWSCWGGFVSIFWGFWAMETCLWEFFGRWGLGVMQFKQGVWMKVWMIHFIFGKSEWNPHFWIIQSSPNHTNLKECVNVWFTYYIKSTFSGVSWWLWISAQHKGELCGCLCGIKVLWILNRTMWWWCGRFTRARANYGGRTIVLWQVIVGCEKLRQKLSRKWRHNC